MGGPLRSPVSTLAISDGVPTGVAVLDGWEVCIARTTRLGEEMAEEDREWPGRLRRLSRAKLRTWGFDALSDTFVLLMTELVTNALQHGRADQVGVRLYRTAASLGIEVNDGTPISPKMRKPGPLDESGRGLPLVEALAEHWGISVDGTLTWCTLAVPADRA